MRVRTVKSSNGSIYYAVIRDIKKENGKRSTQIVENLGSHKKLLQEHPEMDPMDYAKQVARELTEKENEGKITFIHQYDTKRLIKLGESNGFDVGQLFLDKIFYELKLDKLCKTLKGSSKISFDLTAILKMLISTRILYPGSKRSSLTLAKNYLTPPDIDLHQIYRGLDLLSKNMEKIQQHAYLASKEVVKRDTQVLFYDCTNYFFEIEEEDNFRKYGVSKEHRPNPIIQMGLFMDGSGMPLAFSLFEGNKNEINSLKPIEKQIIKDFELSDLIVCTDAGLSSFANKRFNSLQNRHYITTHSIKKMKRDLAEWALSPEGWKIFDGDSTTKKKDKMLYHLDDVNRQIQAYRDGKTSPEGLRLMNATFYKESWERRELSPEEKQHHLKPFEERYIVTYSPKYQQYQANIRERQINRALKKLEQTDPMKNTNPHSPNRFVKTEYVTENGEVVKLIYRINQEAIDKEAQYDGFYCVATNLESSIESIVGINKQRWEIEECFRILKTEFKSRPVYLSRENRIRAHFLTCFLSLLVYRILEQRMKDYTVSEIIQTLRGMRIAKIAEEAFVPQYTRTEITDKLHEISGFRTDYEFIEKKSLKKIERQIKSGK
ncbi:IS1634 family transposase [Tuanshanicoccus lijuaniae]|uniref:IS1634 family transposase n=1 Tax=Aerococcaceae bacterium zg-1292 TaxID=2774330 RepID=UPI001936474A|nr:IS1634 family transposase [Aerococcaceae bacterium zg-A91]MBS4458906.1 IS1634 family transposase [Aerococcaceae bacterium zg-BR33]QQA36551.1 IS1634 family transposase [Aerococcaceae bacterium zg-1292]